MITPLLKLYTEVFCKVPDLFDFNPLLAPYGIFGLGAGNIFKRIKKAQHGAVPERQ